MLDVCGARETLILSLQAYYTRETPPVPLFSYRREVDTLFGWNVLYLIWEPLFVHPLDATYLVKDPHSH